MAAPTFGAAGAGSQVTAIAGTLTVGVTGAASGDILILQVVQDGTQAAAFPALSAATVGTADLAGTNDAMTLIPGTGANNCHEIGSPVAAKQFLLIGRANLAGTPTVQVVNPTSDNIYGRLYRFSTGAVGTTLSSVIENGSAGATANGVGTSVTVADTGVTTLGADRLALNFVGINDDATGLAAFAGMTGGTWALPVAIFEQSTGTDATLGLMTAAMASAGTIDGGSDTITLDAWGVVGFALIGTTAGFTTHTKAGYGRESA